MAMDLPETRTGWLVSIVNPHMVKARRGVIVAERKIGPGIVEIPREVEEEDSFESCDEREEEGEDDVGEILRKRLLELREGCLRQTEREVESLLL